MPYIGNVLTSFAVETGNIVDQAVTAPKLSATGGTNGQVLALDAGGNLVWTSDPAGQWVTSGSDIYYTTGNVGIGLANPTDYYSGANNLVVGNTAGNTGVSIVSKNDSVGRLFFADGSSGTDEYRGYIEYSHSLDLLQIGTASLTAICIDSDRDVHISPNSTSLERLSILTGGSGGIQLNYGSSGNPVSGTELGSIGFKGVESANTNSASEARIRAYTEENHSGLTAATALIFDTKKSGVGPGSAPQPRLYIGGDGVLDLYNDSTSAWGQFARQVRFGYGSPYKCLMLGGNETSGYNSISLGYNVANNNSGAFTGDGREVVVRNNTAILSPNADDTGFTWNIIFNNGAHGTISSQGILFGSDTAAANTLDDYEEGLYTPSFSFSGGGTPTYNSQYASYVKIGNLVHVNGYLSCTSVSGTSGTVRLSGLPYATKNSSLLYHAPAIGWYINLTGITAYGMGLDMAPNSTNHTILYGNGTGVSGLNASNITNNFAIEWAFTYYSN